MQLTEPCNKSLQSCYEVTATSFAQRCDTPFLSVTVVIQGHWQSSVLKGCAKVVVFTMQACKTSQCQHNAHAIDSTMRQCIAELVEASAMSFT